MSNDVITALLDILSHPLELSWSDGYRLHSR